jgi:hypothetical protein
VSLLALVIVAPRHAHAHARARHYGARSACAFDARKSARITAARDFELEKR